MSGPLDVLVLCNRPVRRVNAATIMDHLDAFARYSRNRVRLLSFARRLPSALDLEQFDVLVVHYTVAIGWMSHLFVDAEAKARIRAFTGLKVVFMQDEYRHVDAAVEALRDLGVHVLFTCVPEGEIEKVYPSAALPGLLRINNLTGYVPEGLVEEAVAPLAARRTDVGYRARTVPFWLGELGFEKSDIARRFAEHASGSGLRLDLSYREQERLYGKAWTDFVAGCKAVLGVESGASVFDFDGSLQRRVEDYVAAHPEAGFAEVQEKFLRPYEGRIRLNQISPRCFEAAALRTAMVLYEGEYSGVLEPGRHYLPLRKDFANISQVIAALRDTEALQRMVDCAYAEVARNPAYSYKAFIGRFDEIVEREHRLRLPSRPRRATAPAFRGQLLRSPAYLFQRAASTVFQYIVLGTTIRGPLFRLWDRMPEATKNIFRPFLRTMGR